MSTKTFYELINAENPVFRAYAFWSTVLVLKILAMGILTGRQRFSKKVFSNPEDIVRDKSFKVKFDDPDVERVRRAHLNDLENILPFFAVGFLYVLIDPSQFLAINLFRLFAISRIVHTLVYAVFVIPQPTRSLAYTVGFITTAYMGLQVLLYFL